MIVWQFSYGISIITTILKIFWLLLDGCSSRIEVLERMGTYDIFSPLTLEKLFDMYLILFSSQIWLFCFKLNCGFISDISRHSHKHSPFRYLDYLIPRISLKVPFLPVSSQELRTIQYLVCFICPNIMTIWESLSFIYSGSSWSIVIQ